MPGFCPRCGNILKGPDSRCKCGGTSSSFQATRSMFEPAIEKPKASHPGLKTLGERSSVRPSMASFGRSQTMPPPSKPHAPSSSPPTPFTSAAFRLPSESIRAQNLKTFFPRTINALTPCKAPDGAPPKEVKDDLSFRSPARAPVRSLTTNTPGVLDISAGEEGRKNLDTSVPRTNNEPTPCKPPYSAHPKEFECGLSVKPSARAHVRSLTADMPDSADLSAAEEEVLSNVFGFVFDPNETRGRCGACEKSFQREGKIFPDPRRDDDNGKWAEVFYCRKCYIERFSKGNCGVCQTAIVGDEGFIQLGKPGDRRLWHKKCFMCVHCKVDVSNSPSVDMRGEPCCEGCFDKPVARHAASSGPMKVTDIPDLRVRQITPHPVNRMSVMVLPASKPIKQPVGGLASRLSQMKVASGPPRPLAVPMSSTNHRPNVLGTANS